MKKSQILTRIIDGYEFISSNINKLVHCRTKETSCEEHKLSTVKIIENVNDSSLLDNHAYMKLATTCCAVIEQIDNVANNSMVNSTDLDVIKNYIIEGLVLSGAFLIVEDTEFNPIRHIPVPISIPKTNAKINKIIEPGILIDDRVLKKAKVELY